MTNTGEKKLLRERLMAYESACTNETWYKTPSEMLEACELTENDIPALIAMVRENGESVDDFEDDELEEDDFEGDEYGDDEVSDMLPVLAGRALGCLKATECVAPLLDELDLFAEEEDEWALSEFPYVFGLVGAPAWEPLKRFVLDRRHEVEARVCAIDGLEQIGELSEKFLGPLTAFLIELLERRERQDVRINSSALWILMDLKATEAAEAIEQAFSANCIDHSIAGDWETVRLVLGVDSLGLPMPTDPIDTIEEFRKSAGINCFSDVALFKHGELDEDALDRYLDAAVEAYSKSKEAVTASSDEDDFDWIRIFLEYAATYLGESVRTVSDNDTNAILFEIFPSKVSVEANAASRIVEALTRFWTFIQREYAYSNSGEILAVLKSNAVIRLRRELSKPSNFGMAKSIFMMGEAEGFDMHNPDDLEAFIATYNQRILQHRAFDPKERSMTESVAQADTIESPVRRYDEASVPQPKMTKEELQKFKQNRHKILTSKKKK